MTDEIEVDTNEPEVVEPKSLREELQDNLKAVKERDDVEPVEKAPKKAIKSPKSDLEGISKDGHTEKPLPATAEKPPQSVTAPVKPVVNAPEAWKAELKAKWGALPPEVQAEIARRESDVEKRFTTMDEERNFAKKMKDVITPYMPIIQSEGGTPEGAVRDLLNTAFILRQGTPQQKMNVIIGTARKFGVDLQGAIQASNQPQQVDHVAIARDIARQELDSYKQQQESEKIQAVIEAFASDPQNVHYDKVKPVMAALLTSGAAKDMKDAYDKAINSDPEIRASLQAEKQKADEAERIAQKKAKAEASRYAASSVKGSSPLNGVDVTKIPKRSLRDELKANLRSATEH